MIQHVNILTISGKSMVFREYGATKIDQDLLAGFLSAFSGFMKEISQSEIKSTVTGNSKYIYSMTQNIIVVICTDISENDADIYPKLSKIQNRFLELYGKDVMDAHWNGERSYFSKFQEEIDRIVLGPVKVSIIGWAGVGKTSLTHLIVGKEVNLEYVPTVTADLANYDRLGSRTIVLWDFAGQIQFTDLWDSLLKGTRIVLLVTDSTYHNVQETKKIMDQFLKKYYSHAIIIGIANKQDLSSRLTPKFVEKILEIPTYGMISINPDYRVVIHEILKHAIEEINRMEGIVDSTGGSL